MLAAVFVDTGRLIVKEVPVLRIVIDPWLVE